MCPSALTGASLEVGMRLSDIYSRFNKCFAKSFWPKCSFELVFTEDNQRVKHFNALLLLVSSTAVST